MRKVQLRMNEDYKYQVIKKLVDTNGNKRAASMKINCSLRTIDRLIIKYKENGKNGFIHKNRNRKPSITTSNELRNQIITLYENKYNGANIKHFSELLLEHENIKVSDTAINGWLRSVGILSFKSQKKNKERTEQSIARPKENGYCFKGKI
ncbi:MAG: hypothetical protein RR546_04920 [Erysipelotrichaceae bacterium]